MTMKEYEDGEAIKPERKTGNFPYVESKPMTLEE